MKHRKLNTILVLVIPLLALAAICAKSFVGPRVVGKAVTADRVELAVVQQYNFSGEPFTTSFVFRRPNEIWHRLYFDHQDRYWRRAHIDLDETNKLARVYRGQQLEITFAWQAERYTLHRQNQTREGGQWVMPANWSPTQSVDD